MLAGTFLAKNKQKGTLKPLISYLFMLAGTFLTKNEQKGVLKPLMNTYMHLTTPLLRIFDICSIYNELFLLSAKKDCS